ncbi:hypothetical protein SAMN04488112_11486 [Melghirimyces thermohalophilus]|uniref:Uncharacterized protein n=1 Tax=Melghirimyces thermohalophilus TaxID=1236220 RepID=A0A1G6NWX5_9BACL|nr:hypothetical protein SAMN04488112_11486 [Melghirimyces thermohalophilus]
MVQLIPLFQLWKQYRKRGFYHICLIGPFMILKQKKGLYLIAY